MVRPITREEAQEAIDAVRRACWFHPGFTPVVYRGVFFASAETVAPKPSPGLSAEDFVLGMEALGVPLWIAKGEDGTDRLLLPPGFHLLPAHWAERAEALRFAFPISRNHEAIDFMRRRGDLAIGEEPTAECDPLAALIRAYRTELAVYNASPLDVGKPEDDELAERTWKPQYVKLCDDPPAATTLTGVREAMQLVADEQEKSGYQEDLTINVLRAGLAYFGRVAA